MVIGFELTAVLKTSQLNSSTAPVAVLVVGVLVVVRFVWMFPAAALARLEPQRYNVMSPDGTRETAVAAWADMRGVVTVASALALSTGTDHGPTLPERSEIVVVGLARVPATCGGRRPRPHWTTSVPRGPNRAHRTTDVPDTGRDAVISVWRGYLAWQAALGTARGPRTSTSTPAANSNKLSRRATGVERTVVVRARRRGEVSARSPMQCCRRSRRDRCASSAEGSARRGGEEHFTARKRARPRPKKPAQTGQSPARRVSSPGSARPGWTCRPRSCWAAPCGEPLRAPAGRERSGDPAGPGPALPARSVWAMLTQREPARSAMAMGRPALDARTIGDTERRPPRSASAMLMPPSPRRWW